MSECNNICQDDMEDYIIDNINDLSKKDRNEFLNLIKQSPDINTMKLREKGDGVQIFFNDIPITLIPILYNFIRRKIDNEHKTS